MKKILLFLTALFYTLPGLAAIDARNFASSQQEQDYHALTQALRCPQCQNNNIADSNATIAVDMREKVFELLQEGQSKQDVVNYMVARYGHFVTYDPPLMVSTIILWIAPILLIFLGIFILFKRVEKKRSAVDFTQVLSEQEQVRLNRLLNKKDKA